MGGRGGERPASGSFAGGGDLVAGVSAREERGSDARALSRVYAELFSEEAAVRSLPHGVRAELCEVQFRARETSYRERFGDAERWVFVERATGAGDVIGRVIMQREPEFVLIDLAVVPGWRRKGIGRAVVGRLLADAAERGVALRLTVAHGNPARCLYERMGFEESARDDLHATMTWRPERASDGQGGA